MQKKFIGNLFLLLFLNFLIKPIWILGIDRSVQNRVGLEEYGLYFALFNFSILFNILLDLGLTHYNNQAVSRNRSEVVRNFSYLGSLKVFLGIGYLGVTLISAYVSGYDSTSFKLLLILSLNQFLSSFLLFLRSNLSGLQFYKTDSFLSVADKALMIVICGLLLYSRFGPLEFNVFHFAFAQTTSYALAVFIAFGVVLRKVKVFSWRFNFKDYQAGLKKSLPYAFLILLMALYTRIDGIMVDRMVGSYQSGIYAAAFRLLDMVNQLSYLVGVLLLPMFSNMLGKNESINALSKLSFSLVFAGISALALSGWINADYLMDLLYHNDDPSQARVFKWLMLSSVAFGTTFVFGTLLTAAKHLKTLNIIAFSGLILNVVLNYILIPSHGPEGAAWATFATQSITTLLQAYYSFIYCDLKFGKSYFLQLSGFVIVSIGIVTFLSEINLYGAIKIMLSITLILIFSTLFKVLNFKAAIEIMRTRFK
tara:strand:+ start:66 stop:1505 length:1440 start_codon:yes stop_codon:yes gene_type:complete